MKELQEPAPCFSEALSSSEYAENMEDGQMCRPWHNTKMTIKCPHLLVDGGGK
jgi:hypothetical protein